MCARTSERFETVLIRMVDDQLASNDPPETRQTLERLVREGHEANEAKRLIGFVVSAEMFAMIKEKRPFDRDRFVAALNALPALPSGTQGRAP